MEINSPNQSKDISESDWRRLSDEWESSQESQKSFCSKRHVNYAKFVQKRNQFLLENDQSRLNAFTKVTVASATSNDFITKAPINIILPNGVTVAVFAETDIKQLKAVLVTLGAIAC